MGNRIKVMLVASILLFAFTSIVTADSNNTTTEWVIPGDTTITVTYPTGQGKLQFDCVGEDFTDQGATDQTGVNAGIKVTNDGNQNLIINGSWSGAWQTGISYVNMSIGDDTNSTSLTYTSGNCQTNQTWKASLGQGANEDFWFWSDGVDVAEGTHQQTLVIWSDPA